MSVATSSRVNVSPNSSDANNLAGVPTGALMLWAAATAPDGWLLCNGGAYSRSSYSALFTAIGTTWGAGDGSTTFNVPDTSGRTVRGVGTSSWIGLNSGASGNTIVTLAQVAGADGTKQLADNLPQHRHGVYVNGSNSLASGGGNRSGTVNVDDGTKTIAGNTILDTANTVCSNSNTVTTNAYVGINYIIKF